MEHLDILRLESLTGQNSNQYLRAQYITSPEELDNLDTEVNAYWSKNCKSIPYFRGRKSLG